MKNVSDLLPVGWIVRSPLRPNSVYAGILPRSRATATTIARSVTDALTYADESSAAFELS